MDRASLPSAVTARTRCSRWSARTRDGQPKATIATALRCERRSSAPLRDRRTRTGFAPCTGLRSSWTRVLHPRSIGSSSRTRAQRWRPILALHASARPGRASSTHPRRVSLAMIPGTWWHNPMKAPPCMRWRGIHLAFVAKAARFLGRIFTSRPFTESSDHLERQLPDAPPRNHVPARFLPQFRSFLGAFRLGDVSVLLPRSESPQGVRPTFSRFS